MITVGVRLSGKSGMIWRHGVRSCQTHRKIAPCAVRQATLGKAGHMRCLVRGALRALYVALRSPRPASEATPFMNFTEGNRRAASAQGLSFLGPGVLHKEHCLV